MNNALGIKNWKHGGNNYVLKGNPQNRWVGFQESVLRELQDTYENDFNIVIYTDEQREDDYYCIPFELVEHLFSEENKTTGKFPNRWTAIILDHQFLMHSNTMLAVDISSCYATDLGLKTNIELADDFYIENAKAEINIRLGQSKFRKKVLKNFDNRCALSGMTDLELLTASHIIPWSHRKEFRGDVSNGICLYVEYDALFDKGYISFNDDLVLLTCLNKCVLSNQLTHILRNLDGRQLTHPSKMPLNIHYLAYHREFIFRG